MSLGVLSTDPKTLGNQHNLLLSSFVSTVASLKVSEAVRVVVNHAKVVLAAERPLSKTSARHQT